ncbi:MAG: hypothetical protein E7166_00655 [Firmicutes bacterium]|nr:hypothetical protein [Bacillota bacterium]
MTREQYKQSVKDIMIHKNPYGVYHQQNFNTYQAYDEMTPINSDIINNMPNASIVLSEQVYEMLLAVQEATISTNQEFPFFLYGKETGNNQIEFTEFMSASNNRQNAAASFNQTMLNNLQSRINGNLNNGLVVCHGHSHPPIGNFHQNFSLGDFTSYMEMNQENSVFKNKQVELTSCLVTSTGDINFVFYDNANQNFYRFTNVFVKDANNNYTPVNCYGMNQSEQLSNGGITR